MITESLIKGLFPANKNSKALVEALNKVLPKYGITTEERIAGFLAQCGHESAGFSILKENLNYSSDRLHAVFPKYFPTLSSAIAYGRKPEKIANKVYGGRMGNGPEASGDGYKFRGRGAIQLTGKSNYEAFAKSINKTLDEAVAYCETLEGAIESACWYWNSRNLNAVCDTKDILTMTKKINGGTNGLQERTDYFNKALKLL